MFGDDHDNHREAHVGLLSRERVLALVLIVATAVALYLCYQLALPFLPALTWALALAVVARPLHDWIAARVANANLAAGLSVVAVIIILLGPTLFVMHSLAIEVTTHLHMLDDESAQQRWRDSLNNQPQLVALVNWLDGHIDLAAELRRVGTSFLPQIRSLVTGSVELGFQLLVTLFALFFFFRDRGRVLETLRSLVPLSRTEANEVFARVSDTIHATINGTLLVAMVQGILGGLMFWFLGLPAPVFWGVVMGLLAIVPYLGTFVIWIPTAIFLALQGHWVKAAILVAWGGLVIAFVDNLLYPILVGKQLRQHSLLAFIAIVGGLAVFGASGLVLGPVILAVTEMLIEIWRRRTAYGQPAEEGVNVESGKRSVPASTD